MTTTIPTPYDAEIAKHENSQYEFISRTVEVWEARAEGYRRAKAEAEPLVEALESIARMSNSHLTQEIYFAAVNALAAYTGGQQ